METELRPAGGITSDVLAEHQVVASAASPELTFPDRSIHFQAINVATVVLIETAAYNVFPTIAPHGSAVLMLCVLTLALLQWDDLATTAIKRCIVVMTALMPIICSIACPAFNMLGFAILFSAVAVSGRAAAVKQFSKGMIAVVGLIVTLMLFEQTGLFWQELSRACWTVSFSMSRLTGTGVRFGPSPLGLTCYALAFCLWLSQVRFNRSDIFYQLRLLFTFVVGASLSLITRQLVFVVASGVLIAAFGDWWERPTRRAWPIITLAWSVAYCVVLLTTVVYAMGYPIRSPKSRTIGIVDGGLKTLVLPSASNVVDLHDTVFGGLKLLAPYYGWSCDVLPPNFDGQQLDTFAVLCIINPQVYLTPAQQRAVEGFVLRGGGLLVLGDHTDIGGIRGPLNSLLRFTHISFNYDSAIPLDKGWQWKSCLRTALHPVFWQRQNDSLGICVGASLTCDAPSRVIAIGDRGFSDVGRPNYGVSHLGNEQYDPGEKMGGLPLAAEEQIGQGLVQVWGDTSGFQDSILTGTHTMIASSLEQLRSCRAYPFAGWKVAACLLSIAIVCVFYMSTTPIALLVALIIGCVGFYLPAGTVAQLRIPPPVREAPRLDCSHQPQYPQLDADFRQYRLSESFLRLGKVLMKTNTIVVAV